VIRNPRLWTGLAIAAFAALIFLPRALRSGWPPWLTIVLAVLACVLLVTSWVVGRQMKLRTGLAVGAGAILVIAVAAYQWG
jgi:hypothetical protein